MKFSKCLALMATLLLVACNDSDNTAIPQDDGPIAENLELVQAFPDLTFRQPLDFQSPRDGTNRVFVVEQRGTIIVFDNNGSASDADTFLDLRDRITSGGEQGLLGLAFHPNFASNGYFYVNYTPRMDLSVTSRFQVSATDPNRADVTSEVVLLEVPQPFTNHNGGALAFGPDGFLYIASGDGGSAGDPDNNSQTLSNLLGAILRIDVDNPDSGRNYGIPSSNPFIGQAVARDEIYAYGLRNPWRMSFDAQTGDLWSADVGQDEREEINIITAGGNYGWKLFEGTACFSGDCDNTDLEPPIFEYDHNGNDQSVTGGYVYRGSALPSLAAKYVYADFVDGRIWALDVDGSNNELLLNTDLNIASFGVDADNELYLCAFDGKIYRFQESN